ncbi:MAG: carboxyl transferase domain-containing protein, partial [Thermodesulfobacteriota bacterium]
MKVIRSKIDPNSEEFRKNYENMSNLVQELKSELVTAREDRSQKAVSRLEEQGKLGVRKRLELLLDKNTPFLEIGALAARGMYDGRVYGAGNIAGIGKVGGQEVLVHANDPTIKGGTVYPMGVKKTLRCQTIAMENNLPIIYLIDSGGAYLPLQS